MAVRGSTCELVLQECSGTLENRDPNGLNDENKGFRTAASFPGAEDCFLVKGGMDGPEAQRGSLCRAGL